MRQNSGLAHCVHHDIHWEYCYDYRGRAEFIKANKPVVTGDGVTIMPSGLPADVQKLLDRYKRRTAV